MILRHPGAIEGAESVSIKCVCVCVCVCVCACVCVMMETVAGTSEYINIK